MIWDLYQYAQTSTRRLWKLSPQGRIQTVQQMPMHMSDFDGDAYLTVCIGQILMFLLLSLALLLARKGSSLTITS